MQAGGGVAAGQAAAQHRADVVDLQVRPGEPVEQPVAAFQGRLGAAGPVVARAAQLGGLFLARLGQLEPGELAHRLVQPVAGQAPGLLLGHQRLADQRGQHVQGPGGRRVTGRAHRFHVVQGEPAGEHAAPAQDRALGGGEQVVAPLDRGPERLVARQGGAAAAGEQAEPVVQAVEDLFRREDPGPDRGELDGQRQAVEPADQAGHCRLVSGGQLERARGRGRPLGEQRDRLVLAELGQGFGGTGCGQPERRHRDDVLPRHRERLPAGGDHPQARRRPHQVGHEPGRRAGQVLAVVHDQQQVLVPEIVTEQGPRAGRGLVAQVQGRHDGLADQVRIFHLGQLDQPAAIAEAAGEVGGRPDGQPGLAHPARSDQADQAGLGELLPDLGQLVTAADEAGRLGRKIARAAGGPRHKGRLYGAAAAD